MVRQVYNKAPSSWFDRRCGGDGSGSSGDVGGIDGGNSFDGAYLRPCSWRERRRERRRERGRATKAWQLEEPKEALETTEWAEKLGWNPELRGTPLGSGYRQLNRQAPSGV